MNPQEFNDILWSFYAKNARNNLPWRQPSTDGFFDPYKILVSEIMLQQTQVSRVISKYEQWLLEFPTVESLAEAPLSKVLTAWIGLGYNRRAKFLHESAKRIANLNEFPKTQSELTELPGIGPNTAGAICAYAFNIPVIFIETNIRTVFLFQFFENQEQVPDKELVPLIEQTLDHENPREWYWALMDYGTHIKQTKGNYSKNSKHHSVQSRFIGSKRQIRGMVLAMLVEMGTATLADLEKQVSDPRLTTVLEDLRKEGMIIEKAGLFSLAQ